MIDHFSFDVFLSHSSKDKPTVRALAERLRSDGIKVWFDEWEIKPGDSIPSKIEEGLEASRVLILCMSNAAFASDWATLESQTFRFRDPLNKGRNFLPLRLDDTPAKGSLAQFLYIDWRSTALDLSYTLLLDSCRQQVAPASSAATETTLQPEPIEITSDEWPALVGRARRENWTSLYLLASRYDFASPAARRAHRYVLSEDKVRLIADVLSIRSLSTLGLVGYGIRDSEVREFANLPRLASLDLSSNRIGEEGARELAKLTGLGSLDLGYNKIGDAGARELAKLTGLASLYLFNTGIGEVAARELAKLTNLNSLSVGNNGIGDAGVCELAKLTSLSSLNLRKNGISECGARELAKLTTLKLLNLRSNAIGDAGARELTKLASLRSLDLADNKIGDAGARELSKLTNLTALYLRNNSIGHAGSRELSQITGLTSLDLSSNGIGDAGACAVARITGLNFLELSNNKIGDTGAGELAKLTGLNSLYLGYNKIGNVGVSELANLAALTSLDLGGNGIGNAGARELTKLTGLTSLNLRNGQISDVGASELAKFTALTYLDLTNNQIGDAGAGELAKLTGLDSLYLSSNRIGDAGAGELAKLTRLTHIDLRHNQIREAGARALLESWSHRPGAKRRLDLRNNGDLSSVLPLEVLGTDDVQAILASYRRFRDAAKQQTLRPLNEAKLLVLGNEAAGKTSLVRYLVDGKPRHESENPTRGTAIREKIEIKQWTNTRSGVHLNIWDFGGQEIMHGTHQYFLTRRSLYILVLDARFEDDLSVYHWLRTIRNRSGDSPVIIAINKCDGDRRGPRLDETQIQKDYPGVVTFVRTSCSAGPEAAASIQNLRETIARALIEDERLKHVRDNFSPAYLRVKDAMTDLTHNRRVLERGDFQRICERATGDDAVLDPAEQRGLLGTLHDLGVVVAHGLDRDDPAIRREITLLDPNWLTGAIYTILTSAQIVKQNGVLHRSQLNDLLDPGLYPAKWHEFVLEMMQDPGLGLCFKLPPSVCDERNTETYLIPEALHEKGPDYDGAWPPDALRFRYQYTLLPRGLMPRFIVESHRKATKHETRWLTGVVLEVLDCKILVVADRDRKRIEIAVKGVPSRRRAALNVVLNDLDSVHQLNPGLSQQARVPLPDQPEFSVAYDNLLAMEENPKFGPSHILLPEGANRDYTVRELLDGVRRDT